MSGHTPADKVLLNNIVSGIDSSYENCLKNIEEILSGGMIVKYLLDAFLCYAYRIKSYL